ncbi:MAG: hypothetical protein FWH34_06130 [Desulfovibrionaceae bacterium]|nr:hypothetical protein [Desulfovibrionaceae bacterium]
MLAAQHIKTSDILSFSDTHAYETVIVMPSTRMRLAQRAADVMVGRTEACGLLVLAEDDCRIGFVATANFVYSQTAVLEIGPAEHVLKARQRAGHSIPG